MKIDGRTLGHETLETIRRLSVQGVKEGERPRDVVNGFGFCRTSIYRWMRAEKVGGEVALVAKKFPGPVPVLSVKQRQQVRRWICGKDPRQYGFDFGLWRRQIVSVLVKDRMSIEMGLTAVGRMLHQLGISPQKPLRRA